MRLTGIVESLEAKANAALTRAEAEQARAEAEQARADFPMPMVQTDCMTPVKSMTNGQIYDSKSALRSEYKRAGVTEIGNEKLKPYTIPRPKKKDVQATVEKALSRAGLGA